MSRPSFARRSLSLAALAALVATPTIALSKSPTQAKELLVRRLVTVQLVDAETMRPFALYDQHVSRGYVAAEAGRPYKIVVRNRGVTDLLVVPSVDGLNVLTGKPAATSQGGYILPAYATVSIDGWRKTTSEVAQFYFSASGDSYAARTGQGGELGAIGLAIFKRAAVAAPPVIASPDVRVFGQRPGGLASHDAHDSLAETGGEGQAELEARSVAPQSSASPLPKLGTGHGERRDSPVTFKSFERASSVPNEIVVLEYDRLEGLIDRGIAASPRPVRAPNPFPANGFVPDPPSR